MHKSGEVDVQFDFSFDSLSALGKSSSLFFLTWSVSRGLKAARSGETKKVLIGANGESDLTLGYSGTRARREKKEKKKRKETRKILLDLISCW